MTSPQIISSFQDYIAAIESYNNSKHDIVLFRGQALNFPLLPAIARADPAINTTSTEKKMLADLKRRAPLLVQREFKNDWEWLIFAQHYGLRTRLLDWSSNPLVALWMACSEKAYMKDNSYVYIFTANNDLLVNLRKNVSPFHNTTTQILQPSMNNERIVSQSGWFTAHKYSNSYSKFVSLERNSKIKQNVTTLEILHNQKSEILKMLSKLGVNSSTVFPGIEGLCLHLNWTYEV